MHFISLIIAMILAVLMYEGISYLFEVIKSSYRIRKDGCMYEDFDEL